MCVYSGLNSNQLKNFSKDMLLTCSVYAKVVTSIVKLNVCIFKFPVFMICVKLLMIMEVLSKYSWNLKEMVFKCQIIFVDCLPCLFCQKLILVWHIVHIYFNYNAYAYALYFTYQIKLEHPYYFQ